MTNVGQNVSKRNTGVLVAVLKAFIPYSRENLALAYKPNTFFNQLEYLDNLAKQTGSKPGTVRVTISRAKRAGLLRLNKDGRLETTWRGKVKAKVMPQSKLRHWLVIVFDVPEQKRRARDALRGYLRSTYCRMVQKSVWVTQYDIYDELLEVIEDLEIGLYVTVFVADQMEVKSQG